MMEEVAERADPVRFRIGPWLVDPRVDEITGPGGKRHLEPKAMAVLQHLAASYPEPISKEQLLRAVWGGTVYADHAVHRAIAKIRGALDDDSRNPMYLETIPKRGYRLVLRDDVPPVGETAPQAFLDSESIAVLPFTLLGDRDTFEYVALGFADGLITRLQRFKTFRVISFASTRVFQDRRDVTPAVISRELGVSYVVTGSIRPTSGVCRLSVELAEAPGGNVIWRDEFERMAGELLVTQDDLTLEIAAQLQPEIERAEMSKALPAAAESLASWHLVRRGMWHQYRLRRQDAATALEYFEQALEQDPNSFEAMFQIAWWHWWDLSTKRADGAEFDVVEQFAQRGLALEPRDPRGPELLGVVSIMRGDMHEARRCFRKAIELNPGYAWAYAHLGTTYNYSSEPYLAVEPIETAIRMSPYDLFVFHSLADLALSHYMLKQWPEATERARQSLEIRPGYWLAWVLRIASLAHMDRAADARAMFDRFMSRRPTFSVEDIDWLPFEDAGWKAHLADSLRMVAPDLT